MIASKLLQGCADFYLCECRREHRRPTFKGFAQIIGVSPQTIRRANLGKYDEVHSYNIDPSHLRLISNEDFGVIRELYNHKERSQDDGRY